MALADLDDAALEALMARAGQDSDDDDGMMYDTNDSMIRNLPPPPPQHNEEGETGPVLLGPARTDAAPTFALNEPTPSFAVSVPATVVVGTALETERSFRSDLLSRSIDRDEAAILHKELGAFLALEGDDSSDGSAPSAATQEELRSLRAQLEYANRQLLEMTELAAVASDKAAAQQAKMTAQLAKAEAVAATEVAADAHRMTPADDVHTRAVPSYQAVMGAPPAHEQALFEYSEGAANVAAFDDDDEKLAVSTTTEGGAAGKAGGKVVSKVLRSLSFTRKGRKK